MYGFFNRLLRAALDWRDQSFYTRLQDAPIRIKPVNLATGSELVKDFLYDDIVCPDSAGYIALAADGPNLRLTGICERDFAGPRIRNSLFLDGKPVRPFGDGKCTQLTIAWDAEIVYAETDLVASNSGRGQRILRRVRIVPIVAA